MHIIRTANGIEDIAGDLFTGFLDRAGERIFENDVLTKAGGGDALFIVSYEPSEARFVLKDERGEIYALPFADGTMFEIRKRS